MWRTSGGDEYKAGGRGCDLGDELPVQAPA